MKFEIGNGVILGLIDKGGAYPLGGKECSSQQMPYLRQKFRTYAEFSMATIADMVGEKSLENALHLSAKTFATTYFENKGNGTFEPKILPNLAQLSSVNDILIDDFDGDGNLDMVLAGNLYVSEIETPRNDASYGVFLSGNGKGDFEPCYAHESGLYVGGDVKEMKMITVQGKKMIVVAKNDDHIQMVKIENNRAGASVL